MNICAPLSDWPSSRTRTMRFFLSRARSSRSVSSMALLTRAASASAARRRARSASLSLGGGRRTASNRSSSVAGADDGIAGLSGVRATPPPRRKRLYAGVRTGAPPSPFSLHPSRLGGHARARRSAGVSGLVARCLKIRHRAHCVATSWRLVAPLPAFAGPSIRPIAQHAAPARRDRLSEIHPAPACAHHRRRCVRGCATALETLGCPGTCRTTDIRPSADNRALHRLESAHLPHGSARARHGFCRSRTPGRRAVSPAPSLSPLKRPSWPPRCSFEAVDTLYSCIRSRRVYPLLLAANVDRSSASPSTSWTRA
jgi:hypothetical protein